MKNQKRQPNTNLKKYISQLRKQIVNNRCLILSDEDFAEIDDQKIDCIMAEFTDKYMFRLPDWEIRFFE